MPNRIPEEHIKPKPVLTLVEDASSLLSTGSSKASPTEKPEKLRQELLDKLWMKMAEMYGHRWTSSFGVKADQESVWATVLHDISGRQIANGLTMLVEKGDEFDWPPPANVFRQLCLHVPGLPTEEEAWDQALRGEYKHDAVRVAAKQTGTYDLRTARPDNKTLRKTFARNYAIVRARAVMGKALEDTIPLGIEHEHKSPMQVQFAHSHQQARDLMQAQGIPSDPAQARAMLLAKMGIRRHNHA